MERIFKIRCSKIGEIMSNAKVKGELSAACKTHLHTWYANENEEIYSKYIEKGNAVEDDLIDFMAEQLGFGMAEKNKISVSDEYIQGTCDVALLDTIVDVKSAWNRKTLHQQVVDGLDKDYEWQLLGYCHLYKKSNGILFFGLMNTPETNRSDEVIYDDMPANERWHAYNVPFDAERINLVIERVKQCRVYLEGYDNMIKNKLGKIK